MPDFYKTVYLRISKYLRGKTVMWTRTCGIRLRRQLEEGTRTVVYYRKGSNSSNTMLTSRFYFPIINVAHRMVTLHCIVNTVKIQLNYMVSMNTIVISHCVPGSAEGGSNPRFATIIIFFTSTIRVLVVFSEIVSVVDLLFFVFFFLYKDDTRGHSYCKKGTHMCVL